MNSSGREWILDGEKYALVGLNVELADHAPPEQVAPALWVRTDETFQVPTEWRRWLGFIRSSQLETDNLFLISKVASATPDVLDCENQTLKQRVWHFYVGLLLSARFSPSHKPVMLTGARRDGRVGVSQISDLELPASQSFAPPALVRDDLLRAAKLGRKLEEMQPDGNGSGFWQLNRVLHLYVETRSRTQALDRIHQYCRCVEGLIRPAAGKTKAQFKSRTEIFIGPGHHDLMDDLYDIRSDVEHLHEYKHLQNPDKEKMLLLDKMEENIEFIARMTLARIICDGRLWQFFRTAEALEGFWALPKGERQDIWGDPFDPTDATDRGSR